MPVGGGHQAGNEQTRQPSLAEVVADKQVVSLIAIQGALKLQPGVPLARSENRILAVVLSPYRDRGLPLAPAEIGVYVADRTLLVEAPSQSGDGERLALAPHIIARVFKRSTRSPESFLTGLELRWQAHRRQARQGHRATGNAAAAINHFKTETVGNRISLCLVHLDQYVLLLLGGDAPPRLNLRPVVDSGSVEPGFRGEHVAFPQRLVRLQAGRSAIDQLLIAMAPAQSHDFGNTHLWPFVNFIRDYQLMGLLGQRLHRLPEVRRQISQVQVARHNVVAVLAHVSLRVGPSRG